MWGEWGKKGVNKQIHDGFGKILYENSRWRILWGEVFMWLAWKGKGKIGEIIMSCQVMFKTISHGPMETELSPKSGICIEGYG